MSLYEQYNITYKDYNEVRVSVGIDLIFNIIQENKFKKIADIGCGSGSYLKKLHSLSTENNCNLELLGLDGSISMLSNIPDYIKTKHIVFDKNTKLNIENVDMIIINQVIHHIDDKSLLNLLDECMQSLNKDGVLYINTCTFEQVLYGQWWSSYFPQCGIERFADKAGNVNNILLQTYKYSYKSKLPEPLQNNYYDYNKVFTKEFRNCDSMWSLLTTDELTETLKDIKQDLLLNDMKKIDASELYRKKNGQTTSYIFRKD